MTDMCPNETIEIKYELIIHAKKILLHKII